MSVGTVEDLGNGRYRARLPRALDKNRKSLGTFASAEEAHSVINGTLALAQNHRLAVPGGETFRSFLAEFLNRRELSGIRNIDRDRRMARLHLETADFADRPLKAIVRVQVKDWLDKLQRKTAQRTGERLRAQSIRNCLNLLRVCFQDAMDRGLIEHNHARDLRLNRATLVTTEEPWTYLEPHEQEAFLAAIPADGSAFDERNYYAFAIGTGLRPGEQRALHVEDVHLEGEEPYVHVRYGSPGKKPTKTGRTRRVTLFGLALEAAKAQAALLKCKRNPKRLFWPNRAFEYRTEGSPENWNQWLRAAGIKRPVRVYDLRHTFASSLVAGWWGRRWTLEEIKAQLGHTDIKMTQRYAHLGLTALRTATRETTASYSGPRLFEDATSAHAEAAKQPEQAQTESSARAAEPGEVMQNTTSEIGPCVVRDETEVSESAQIVAAFVNRRSRVQISKLAPERLSWLHRSSAA